MAQQVWQQWQQQVLHKIRDDYDQVLTDITLDDIDWGEWRHFYERGQTPHDAVEHAFERVPG